MKTGVVLCAIGAAAAAAHAGPVELVFVERGAGVNVSSTFFGDEREVFVGQLVHDISGLMGGLAAFNGRQITYCPDYPEDVPTDPTMYDVVPLNQVPVPGGGGGGGGGLDAAQTDAVLRLMSAAGNAFDDGLANNGRAGAFQMVLWEIIYDFDGTAASLDIESGNMSFTRTDGTSVFSGQLGSNLTGFLDAAINGAITTGVIALANDGSQDQLFLPTPGAAAMLAMSGLAVARRRR